jgi:hypothetical protein
MITDDEEDTTAHIPHNPPTKATKISPSSSKVMYILEDSEEQQQEDRTKIKLQYLRMNNKVTCIGTTSSTMQHTQ